MAGAMVGEENYAGIKSEFVKEEMRKTSWEDRGRIADLIRIEQGALGKPFGGFAGAMVWHNLKWRYPKELLAIYKELNPKEYPHMAKQVQEIMKDRRENEELKDEEEQGLRKTKEEWIAAGGKI